MVLSSSLCQTGKEKPDQLLHAKKYLPTDQDQLAVEFRLKGNESTTRVIKHNDTVEMYMPGTEYKYKHGSANTGSIDWKCGGGEYILPIDNDNSTEYTRMGLAIRDSKGKTNGDDVLLNEEVSIGGNSGGPGGTTKFFAICHAVGQNCDPAVMFKASTAQPPSGNEMTLWVITNTPDSCATDGLACTTNVDCCSYDPDEDDLRCMDKKCAVCLPPESECERNDHCCNNLCESFGPGVPKKCADCAGAGVPCSQQGTDLCCDGHSCSFTTATCEECLDPGTPCAPLANCCGGDCDQATKECVACVGEPCNRREPNSCPCYELRHPCTNNTQCASGLCAEGTAGNFCTDNESAPIRIDWWWWVLIGMVAVVIIFGIILYARYQWNRKAVDEKLALQKTKALAHLKQGGAPAMTPVEAAKKRQHDEMTLPAKKPK